MIYHIILWWYRYMYVYNGAKCLGGLKVSHLHHSQHSL